MREICAPAHLPEERIAPLRGKFLADDSFDIVVGGGAEEEPVTVRRPDGEILLKYLPNTIPAELCATAFAVLRTLDGRPRNRGTAAGYPAIRPPLLDGSISKTLRVPAKILSRELRGVNSTIVGAFERNSPRYPVCRLSTFNINHPDRFAAVVPYFQAIDRVFETAMPERRAAQMDLVRRTHPAWMVSGTAFTTVTVNKDFRTAVHQDVGDLKEGFGVMSCLRAGHYQGCFTVFPAFRVAVDMSTGGVLLADVHQWHGNTELRGKPNRYERVAVVLYYRADMHRCGSPEEEIDWGKRRKPGDPIWPRDEKIP